MKFAVTILLLLIGAAYISARDNGRKTWGNPSYGTLVAERIVDSPYGIEETTSYRGVSSESIIVLTFWFYNVELFFYFELKSHATKIVGIVHINKKKDSVSANISNGGIGRNRASITIKATAEKSGIDSVVQFYV